MPLLLAYNLSCEDFGGILQYIDNARVSYNYLNK